MKTAESDRTAGEAQLALGVPVGGLQQVPQAPAGGAARELDQRWLLHQVGYAATRVGTRLKRNFIRDLGGIQMTVVEFSLMTLLADNQNVNQKQLCQALDLSAPRLAVILDRMVERRLVRRTRNLEDRRESVVHLTPQGQALHGQAKAVAAAMNTRAVSVLSDEEHATLIALLHKVARIGAAT